MKITLNPDPEVVQMIRTGLERTGGYCPCRAERIEENRNRSIEGTGLGLSIVNGLLAQMGSVLCIQSEYGKGSTFSLELPKS